MNDKAALPDSVFALTGAEKWRAQSAGQDEERFSLGAPAFDDFLHGGLSRHALHEVFSATKEDITTAAAFALLLTLRLGAGQRRIYWISDERQDRTSGRLYPLGLAALGADPGNMILIRTANMLDALRAAADAIRSKSAAAVILEVHGVAKMLDLTSSRRLSLAAKDAKALVLLVRGDAMPMPSAAISRWQISAAPSQSLPANAPGFPAFDVSLLRHRGGIAPFETRMIWDHEKRSFYDAPLSGGLSAAIIGGEGDPYIRATA
jgi:protein ImuA